MRHQDILLAVLHRTERCKFRQVVLTDDDAAGMQARAAHRPLQHLRIFERIGYQFVFGYCLGMHRRNMFNTVLERDFVFLAAVHNGTFGHQLLQPVRLGERQILHTRHIGNGHFRGHGAECDDVGDPVAAVTFCKPAQHIRTTLVIEIHVDIRQGDTVRIEEPFEQQIVFERVYVGDAQAVGHHGTRS